MSVNARPTISRGYGRDRAGTDRTMAQIEERLRMVPSVWPQVEAVIQTRRLIIDVGNGALIGNSLEGVLFSPSLSLSQAYDPNVDTVYPAGLCCGFLIVDGVPQGKVLIRHDYANYPIPILQGTPLDSPGTTTLIYDPGGGDPVVTMTAYLIDFL